MGRRRAAGAPGGRRGAGQRQQRKGPARDKGIFGAGNVARVLAAIVTPFAQIGVVMEPREVNGQPGAIFRDRDGKVVNTWALDILDGRIRAIRTVISPGKLGHAGPVADAWTVLREANRARRLTAGADTLNRPGVSAD